MVSRLAIAGQHATRFKTFRTGQVSSAGLPVGRGWGSATGGAPMRVAGTYMSKNSEDDPRRAAS